MSLHTFVIDGRKRLQISQSKTKPGKVLVQVLDWARDVLVSCTMDAPTAAVIAQAFELEAAAAECKGDCTFENFDSKFCPRCHERLSGGAEYAAAVAGRALPGARRTVGPAMVQAYADTNGVPPGRALPVVSEAELNAQWFARRASDSGAETVGA